MQLARVTDGILGKEIFSFPLAMGGILPFQKRWRAIETLCVDRRFGAYYFDAPDHQYLFPCFQLICDTS